MSKIIDLEARKKSSDPISIQRRLVSEIGRMITAFNNDEIEQNSEVQEVLYRLWCVRRLLETSHKGVGFVDLSRDAFALEIMARDADSRK